MIQVTSSAEPMPLDQLPPLGSGEALAAAVTEEKRVAEDVAFVLEALNAGVLRLFAVMRAREEACAAHLRTLGVEDKPPNAKQTSTNIVEYPHARHGDGHASLWVRDDMKAPAA